AAWQGVLDNGTATRFQVVQAIQNSQEGLITAIQGIYFDRLGRSADSVGLSASLSFLKSGGTQTQLQAVILSSNEFFTKNSDGTVNGKVTALYTQIFDRAVDPAGGQAWAQVLNNGVSATVVALALLDSPESDQDSVR